jgi:WD40 repeat protein
VDSARYERLRELFVGAGRLEGAERAAWLDDECGDDSDLRRDVEKLLAHDAHPATKLAAVVPGEGAKALAREVDLPGGHDDGEQLPRQLGRYALQRVIGRGGMGVVYEAEQQDPNRRVALKVIRPGRVHGALSRFRQEAQVLGQLQHPGIAQIYEAGAADEGEGGQPYFAMELIDGKPLLEYADSTLLGPRERLELLAQICDAVHHAHLRGVIHRDLKPANILVTDIATGTRATSSSGTTRSTLGRPKILDFGVARLTDADIQTVTVQTSVGELVGTVPYMSPEQAAGDPAGIDIRSDVYALGVTGYELLTGRLPYEVGGKLIHEAVRVIREHDATRLGTVDRVYRGDVEIIFAKALEKEPERRYQSAEALAEDIRRHLGDEPIVARPASAFYQVRKFARRNRALTTGVAIAFVAMFTAMIVSLWQTGIAREQRGLADERAIAAEQSAWEAYRSAIAAAGTAIDLGDPLVAWQLLDSVSEDHRNWETGYLLGQADSAIATMALSDDIVGVTLDADGARVITVDRSGLVQRWDPHRPETPVESVRLDAPITGVVAVSPGGDHIAGVIDDDESSVAIWDGVTGARRHTLSAEQIRTAAPRTKNLRLLAIAPDGSQVLAFGTGGNVHWTPERDPFVEGVALTRKISATWSICFSRDGTRWGRTFKRRNDASAFLGATDGRLYTHGFNQMEGLALSSDGSRAVAGGSNARVVLVDTDTGRRVREFVGHTAKITAAAIDAGDRRGATGANDGTVRVWDLERGTSAAILPGHVGEVATIVFSDDGRRLLTRDEHAARVFDLDRHDPATVLAGHSKFVYGVGFTARGGMVVSGAWDGTIRFWGTASGEALATIPTRAGRVYSIAAPPDAPFVVSGHERGRALVWCTETGRQLHELNNAGGARVTAMDVTPDGSRLVTRQRKSAAVWDPRTGELIQRLETGGHVEFGAATISADGARVAIERGSKVLLWDVGSPEPRHLVGHENRVHSLDLSPDGTLLASGGRDHTVRLWDVASGECLHVLDRHSNRVYAVEFSPDGTRLATASDDQSIVIWEPVRGDELLTLIGHERYVYALAFSPDGRQLVSGSGDHTALVWDSRRPSARLRIAARMRAKRAEMSSTVDRLFASLGDAVAVAAAVNDDPDLDDDARRAALQVVLRRANDTTAD